MVVGDGNDGTYVTPSSTFGATKLISPGVGPTSSFELYWADRGVSCFLFDASVARPKVNHANFNFYKKFVGLGKDEITLDLIVESHFSDSDSYIMQMDIEGGEWEALSPKGISDSNLLRANWIVLELHELQRIVLTDYAWMSETLSRLIEFFQPIFLNCNNSALPIKVGEIYLPPVIEVTLIRKDLLKELLVFSQSSANEVGHMHQKFKVPLAASWMPGLEWPL